MKFAICYSGNLRTFEYCVKNHAQFFKKADVYISTWDTISLSETINDPWHIKVDTNIPTKVDVGYIQSLIPDNFNIKDINIESYENYKVTPLQNYNHLWFQYYKIKDCFNLVKDDYDFLIRIRTDITINKFYFEKGKLTFNENVWYNHKYNQNHHAHINEMIWVSDYELMEKSVRIYDNLETLNNTLPYDKFYGESITYNSLKMENLLDSLNFFDFEYRVIR